MFNFLKLKPFQEGATIYLFIHLILAIISNILILIGPLLIGTLINNIEVPTYPVYQLAIIIAICYLVGYILLYLSNVMVQNYTVTVIANLRLMSFKTLNNASLYYLDNVPTGDIIQRFTTDSDIMYDAISLFYLNFFPGVVTVIFSSIILIIINIWMALIVFTSGVVIYLYARTATKKVQQQFYDLKKIEASMSTYTEDILKNEILVNSYYYQPIAIQEFRKQNNEFNVKADRSYFLASINNPTFRLINYLFYTLLGVVFLLLSYFNQSMLIGTFLSVLIYANLFAKPFNDLSNLTNQFLAANASWHRINLLIAENEQENNNNSNPVKELTVREGEVIFRNVSFSYVADEKLIENFNLKVSPGQKVAIVGHTGSGKTTLVNLLLRFYDYQMGDIIIDGHKIKDVSVRSLRKNIGLVLQEPWLFNKTIYNNITYGTENLKKDDVIKAAKIAGVHDFIMLQSKGYETVITEATQMSEGQKQLITLARAIVKDPKILILDEATSQIDSLMEYDIQTAFSKATKNKTTFVIAHRLKTIIDSDHIILMKRGKIIEQGNHINLIKEKGEYYNLYMSQFSQGGIEND